MKRLSSVSGQDLRDMFQAATSWLEKSASDIDALNVFPVPDGDTGTNMLLTMRSSVEEAYRAPDHSTAGVAQAIAKGALLGARGNSGVILSQIWRGLAESLAGKEEVSGKAFAEALKLASRTAYSGVSNPVEGTILTVIKDVAKAAEAKVAEDGDDIAAVVEAAVQAARESVAKTPTLLPVLREAGVVDAGGQGLYTILEGALHYLMGETDQMQFRKPQVIASEVPLRGQMPRRVVDEVPFGYCTEFLLKGEGLNPGKVRKKLVKKGESLIVVGDKSTVRVHIHTLEPGEVINYATSLGTMHQVSVRNMDEQYQDFLDMRKERAPTTDVAIVTVVAGDGLTEVFNSLGVAAVVPGGQTMNPSTKDLLKAVEAVASEKVIILPNNRNIIPAAKQVQSLTGKRVEVVPTESIPQGVAAVIAFDYEAEFETNIEIMKKARSTVRSIEVTRAVRSARLGGLNIKRKQYIGFLDGDLVAVGNEIQDVLGKVFSRLELDKAQVLTVYYGAGIGQAQAEEVKTTLGSKYSHLQVEVVKGEQPHYEYIISVE
ncbi:MAG: DAK2 domain-containing protein [Chloroflexota bacterium]